VPILRKVWAKKGSRPVAKGRRRYQWLYLYGFVHPATGRVFWLTLPTVNIEVFGLALRAFAEHVGIHKHHRVVLVVDGAGWHRSAKLQLPEGLHLVFLPAYSPELQPSERLWPLANEALANRAFQDIDELEERLLDRCNALTKQNQRIHRLTCYHWWPKDRTPAASATS
jgi:transposase